MRTLLFKNNVHNTEPQAFPGLNIEDKAINLTVRKGLKWSNLKEGDVVELQKTGETPPEGVESYARIWDVKVMPFNALMHYPQMLKVEHDPVCQLYGGLLNTMRRVYDGFLPHEIVTLVFYELLPDQS